MCFILLCFLFKPSLCRSTFLFSSVMCSSWSTVVCRRSYVLSTLVLFVYLYKVSNTSWLYEQHGVFLITDSNYLPFASTWIHPGILVVSVLLFFLVFCVVFFCCVCLRPVSCVPNVTSVSGLSSSCFLCTHCDQCLWIVFVLCLVYPMWPVSLDCPFLVFSYVYVILWFQ